ncbi:uncharacterized protein I206_101805 [Kwoniella pini CBS 10737]|uniref:Uncharacterized protein n=1 Tax=Kwoniella pini CBS 10737 TaxID=1296096 RepID=A0A1B9HVM7_9TREE|nr:uncharacterized protein I206_06222 [Kwoniella pini CBS 10737]OCF47327.1 hypothetical protein I206_06222 [Kwoniella pini CBS 10737]
MSKRPQEGDHSSRSAQQARLSDMVNAHPYADSVSSTGGIPVPEDPSVSSGNGQDTIQGVSYLARDEYAFSHIGSSFADNYHTPSSGGLTPSDRGAHTPSGTSSLWPSALPDPIVPTGTNRGPPSNDNIRWNKWLKESKPNSRHADSSGPGTDYSYYPEIPPPEPRPWETYQINDRNEAELLTAKAAAVGRQIHNADVTCEIHDHSKFDYTCPGPGSRHTPQCVEASNLKRARDWWNLVSEGRGRTKFEEYTLKELGEVKDIQSLTDEEIMDQMKTYRALQIIKELHKHHNDRVEEHASRFAAGQVTSSVQPNPNDLPKSRGLDSTLH